MDGAIILVTLQKVYYPLLCILGIPANLFTLSVLCLRACGMSSSARVYLSSLALVDTCYLVWVILLDLSLTFLQDRPFWNSHPWCNVLNFLQFGTFYGSAWLVVAFTVERFLVLRASLSRRRPLQTGHALLTCSAIVLFSHLASVPNTWINVVVQVNVTVDGGVVSVPRCRYREALYSTVVVWITSFLSSGVPILLVVVFNSLIAHQLLCSRRLFTAEERRTLQGFRARGSIRRTLLLLGTVSLAFVVLTLPRFVTYCILRTTYNHNDFDRDNYGLVINTVSDVANMLHTLNSSTNFLLYCAVSRRFRQELLLLLACRSRTPERSSLLTHTTMKVFSLSEHKRPAGPDSSHNPLYCSDHSSTHKPSNCPYHNPTHSSTYNLIYCPYHSFTHKPSHNLTHSSTHNAIYSPYHNHTHSSTHNPTYSSTHNPVYSFSHNHTHSSTHNHTYSSTHNPIYSSTHNNTYSSTHNPTYSFSHNPTHSSTHNPIYSSTHNPIYSSTHKPIYSSSHNTIYSSYHNHTHSSTHNPIYSSTHNPIYSSTHNPIYSFSHNHTYSSTHNPIYSSTHNPIYSSTHNPIYSFSHNHTYSSTQNPIYSSTHKPIYSSSQNHKHTLHRTVVLLQVC
ncbi:galanin receptor 2a-like [Hoplias malabaricus]|uniref:galanin receptor 2a-like n=1 Tax=Hoplias malabaricus TaxID=27720 RepID=UPI003462A672